MLLFLPARLRHPCRLRYSVGVSVFGNCQDFPPRGKKGSLGADAFSEQLVAALRVTAIGAPVIHVSRGSLKSKREATWEAGICNNYGQVFTVSFLN